MHQKHPPAKVAFSSRGESARVEVTPIATKMATTKIGTPKTIVRQLFITQPLSKAPPINVTHPRLFQQTKKRVGDSVGAVGRDKLVPQASGENAEKRATVLFSPRYSFSTNRVCVG
jgi:hypothetical protein